MFDYNLISSIPLDDLQREAILQTRAGKPQLSALEKALRGAKLKDTPLTKISKLDVSGLVIFAAENNEEVSLPVAAAAPAPENNASHPLIKAGISSDKMVAKLTIVKPPLDTPAPTLDEVLAHLKSRGIVYGIKKELIQTLLSAKTYGVAVTVAEGSSVINGEDGKVEFTFAAKPDFTPPNGGEMGPNYADLSWFSHIKSGDVLCHITPPGQGTPGLNVLGETTEPLPGKPSEIVCGNNTALSDDKSKIIATCDGQVLLKHNRIIVSKVMQLDKVDNTTGNILFSGSLVVNGDISGNCTLRIGGDIIVKGTITGGNLVSGSSIVCTAGINGGGSALTILATNYIRATFIEHATITAGKNIYADAIMNTNITCSGSVILDGSRGCYVGGSCNVFKELRLKDLGNDAGIETNVTIIGANSLIAEKDYCSSLIESYQSSFDDITALTGAISKRINTEPAQMPILMRLVYLKRRFADEILRLTKHASELAEDIHNKPDGMVIITGYLYPNVILDINGAYYKNDKAKLSCSICKRKGIISFGLASSR